MDNNYYIKNCDAGQRLDKFLLKFFNKSTKAFIYKMLRKKRIKLNNSKAIGNEILKADDILTFYISPETIALMHEDKNINANNANISVIYEDKNILLINKDYGEIVHPDINHKTNTLSDKILLYLNQKGEYNTSDNFTPSICNRLDRNTSGIITAGKNLKSTQALNKAFKENKLDKFYITAVCGNVKKSGIIKGYHIKNNKNIVKIYNTFVESSSEVITEYEPLKHKNNYTLLKIKLITGKSHQIRAMLKTIGYPIVGDKKYGNGDDFFNKNFGLENQLLHCYSITFKQKESPLDYLFEKTFIAEPTGIYKNCFDYFNEV